MTQSPVSTLGQVADQAQQTTGQVAVQAKQQATSQLESQKQRAVDSLVTVAQALRQTSQHLHEQQQAPIAGYVDQAAARVEGFTNHLRSHDVNALVGQTEELARRRPGLFVGTALALGFVGARFLMASGQRAAAQRAAQSGLSPSLAAGTPGYGYGNGPYSSPEPATGLPPDGPIGTPSAAGF